MRVAGIVDMMPMNNPGKYRIFLGFFMEKSSAVARLNTLLAKDYSSSMEVIEKIKIYWTNIAYLPHSGDALKAAIPGTHRAACNEFVKPNLIE